jgi:cyclophilin family peptidyl-prolyl cis-trans isomerase/predicted small secreted protein
MVGEVKHMLNRALLLVLLAALAVLLLSCNRVQSEGKSYSSAGKKPGSGTVTVAPGTVAGGEEQSTDATGEAAPEAGTAVTDGETAPETGGETTEDTDATKDDGAAQDGEQAKEAEDKGEDSGEDKKAADEGEKKPEKIPANQLPSRMRQVTRAMFETDKGNFIVAIYPEIAPISAPHFINLIQAGFYDGIVIHRYDPGYVVQMGLVFGPDGSPLYPDSPRKAELANETIPDEPCLSENTDMTVSFAKPDMANGASCQFFVNLSDNRKLDDYSHGFTVMGQVIHGSDAVRKLRVGDKILRAYVLREGSY